MAAWYVVIGDKNGSALVAPSGKEQRLWFPQADFQSESDAFAHVRLYFHAVTPLRAYQSDEQPGIVLPTPAAWYEFGTNRLRAEIEAGLRPDTDTIQPPIDLDSQSPQARKGKVLWRKRILS